MKSLLFVVLALLLTGTAANAVLVAGNGELVGVGTITSPRTPVSFTQNWDTTTIEAVQVACGVAGTYTTQNWYLRRFYMSDYGILNGLQVLSVDLGVEQLDMADGSTPPPYAFALKLYGIDTPDPFTFANLESLGAAIPVTVNETDEGTIINAPVPGYILGLNKDLVVAFDAPDGSLIGAGLQFRPGANSIGADLDAYLAAADCGVNEPIAVSSIGFPDSQTIMVVNGDDQPGGTPTNESSWGAVKAIFR
jgi:hypothetical protein